MNNKEEFTLEESINLYKQRWNNKLNKINRTVLNRRKKKLDELLEGESDFFSEDSIKQRDPILYEIYVGSYRRRHPIPTQQNSNNVQTSKFLLNEIDQNIHLENIDKEIKKEIDLYGKKEMNKVYVRIFY